MFLVGVVFLGFLGNIVVGFCYRIDVEWGGVVRLVVDVLFI